MEQQSIAFKISYFQKTADQFLILISSIVDSYEALAKGYSSYTVKLVWL